MLPRAERDKVLAEMRMMLESVSSMLQALGDNDPAAAARAARGSGIHPIEPDPKIRKLLPKQFLELGDLLHKRLDDLANRLKARRHARRDHHGPRRAHRHVCGLPRHVPHRREALGTPARQ